MPGTSLFGVSYDGRVYVLPTSGSRWHELDYLGIEFKHVSAIPNCVWAVGGDRQIYLHVHGLDIPIRVKEESYENQRWLPFSSGFSGNRLLPTDRFPYSSEDGTVDRSWDKVELPSRAWAWESEWQKELVLEDGQPLDHEGWMYAVDFPATYGPQKHFNSFVRRRKWYRYRRYVALNSWCALPPLHRDPTQEPFIDISIGGHQIASCEPGTLCVWAITVQGRLLFRSGITAISPEGSHWAGVPLMQRCEPAQLSVGPCGHVWCVLWDGRVLVRDKISREQLQGEQWLEVSPPEAEGSIKRLRQVAVGLNVVWAVASDGSVWFRRGVSIPDRPAGNGWVPMTGDMAQVSVGANDQVWAVGSEDRSIYFRTGIVPEEMTGRTWRKVQVGVRKIRTDRASTSSSTGSSSGINISSSPSNRHHVHQLGTSAIVEKPTNSFIHKTPPLAPSVHASVVSGSELATNQLAGSLDNLTMQDNQAADISALLTGGQQDGACSSLPTHYLGANKQLRGVRDSSRSLTQLEASKLSGTDSETDSVFGEDEEMFMTDFMPRLIHETDDMAQQSWNWVAAGACTVDPLLPPAYWFTDVTQSRSSNKMSEPWRNRILDELKTRSNREVEGFNGYEAAVDTKSWVQSGKAKVMLPRGSNYEECVIELEWVNSTGGLESSGTLSILSPDKAKTKTQLNLSELAIAMVTSEPGLPRLSLYESCNGARAAMSKGQKPVCRPCLQLVFPAEKDMEAWQTYLNTVCCNLQWISGAPGPGSIWATTALGDVFVWDPSTLQHRQSSKDRPGVFRQELASYPQPLPCEAQLSNAFCLGSALEVIGRPHTKAERFTVNIQSYWGNVTDPSKSIALHFNPRFKENCVVRNTKDCGVWGMEEREGELPFETEVEFRLRIECHTECFVIFVNGEQFTTYTHRLRPENMGFIAIMGDVSVSSIIYESKEVAFAPSEMFWRQIGGHLHKVETCDSGIVWGLGFDGRAWVYTGGCGGGCFGASDTANSNGSLQAMTDTQSYYIYENQRWNPLTGYSSTGLPTDRPTWSDKSGKIKCSKDKIKLQSMHWQWLSDWRVDFHVSGGVDKEGWQYAVDFPASYHSRKKFTDYVRRRRWERKCVINTSGPWMELGGTKLHDISLRSEKGETTAWAVAANGDALYRCGITKECPQGENWQHVPCEQALSCISLGKESKLWAVGKKGSAFWRFGITPSNPTGKAWVVVEPPSPLQQISVDQEVWALDKEGKVYLRREVTSVFPEGTHWLMSTDTPDTGSKHVRHISCGPSGLWAVLGSGDDPGALGLRCGITDKASSGISWNFATSTGWLHISARSSWATKDEEKESN